MKYYAIFYKPSHGDEEMMYKFVFNSMDSFFVAQKDTADTIERNEEDIQDFCDYLIVEDLDSKTMNEIDKILYEHFGRTWSRKKPDPSWVYPREG